MADDIKITSGEVFEYAVKYPDYRIVGAVQERDMCTPLKLAFPAAGGIGFAPDMAATMNHKHALCAELLERIGEVDETEKDIPVLVKLSGDDKWVEAKTVSRITRDDGAQWIKLHYPHEY